MGCARPSLMSSRQMLSLEHWKRFVSRVVCAANAEVRVIRSLGYDSGDGGGGDGEGVVVGREEAEQDELTKFP